MICCKANNYVFKNKCHTEQKCVRSFAFAILFKYLTPIENFDISFRVSPFSNSPYLFKMSEVPTE